MGIEIMILRTLVCCFNHWAIENWMVSKSFVGWHNYRSAVTLCKIWLWLLTKKNKNDSNSHNLTNMAAVTSKRSLRMKMSFYVSGTNLPTTFLIFFPVLSHGQDKDRSGVPTVFKPIHATKAYLYYLADSWFVLKTLNCNYQVRT